MGQNVPFQTGSYTTDAAGANNPFTTIERKDVGVTLKVTPHINEGGALRLEIEQEISSIAPSTGLASQAVDLVTNKRSIKSTVLADNGEVIVLGGLIQDDVTRSESKVPLLGDLPLLGGLFRSSKDSNVKRNLMVFLRPSVVRDGAGLASLSQQKYQDIRVFGDGNGAPQLLPADPQRLFQRAPEALPELPPAAPPLQTLMEKPRRVDPATLEDGRGGEDVSAPVAAAAPAQRYSIALVEGSSEAYMRTLLAQHPKEPLRLQQEQRKGQPWYRIFYGNYPRADLAERALRSLPASLPKHRGQVVAL